LFGLQSAASIRCEFPETKPVKALNTCNCQVMVDPGRVKRNHDIFIWGNDQVKA